MSVFPNRRWDFVFCSTDVSQLPRLNEKNFKSPR